MFRSSIRFLILCLGFCLVSGCGTSADPTLESIQADYNTQRFDRAAEAARARLKLHPDDLPTLQYAARAAGRLGRDDEALKAFGSLTGDMLAAEDLIVLSRSLTSVQRPLLGRLALEAGIKLDPNNGEVRSLLASGSASKTERVGKLAATPSAPALGELLLRLLSFDAGSSEPGPILAELLRRDRDQFRALDTADKVRKLLARVCLENGRPNNAHVLIQWINQKSDPETIWLDSRIKLALGDVPNALETLKRSGTYRAEHPVDPEPCRYVGAEACRTCHEEIYASQQKSLHASTLVEGQDLAKIPLPKGPVTDPEDPTAVHTFTREGDRIHLKTRVKDETVEALIDYAMGSGHLGQTMLAKDASGGHRSLRLSYYTGGDHWGLTTGFEPHPKTAAGFIGELLTEDGFNRCLHCHSTRFISPTAPKGPEAKDRGIGCERCHGPGENHVKTMEANVADLAIARPKVATPAQRFGVCVQCHGSDGVIPPSDPRFVRFQGAVLPYSRCYTESGKKLDCVSCHSPHGNLQTKPQHYETRCLACHSGKETPRDEAKALDLEAVKASVCPVNPKNGCIDCHMPKVDKAMPFTKLTDHHIRIHRPTTTATGTSGKPVR